MDFAQGAAPAVLGLRALASADAVELADALSPCGHSWILGPEYGSLSFRAVLTGKREKKQARRFPEGTAARRFRAGVVLVLGPRIPLSVKMHQRIFYFY